MARSLLVVLVFSSSLAAQTPPEMEARLTDGSRVKLVLLDAGIPVITPHGRLVIPVAEIRRLEFAARLSEEVRQRLAGAMTDLASTDAGRREAAGDVLLKIGPPAYPAVLRASKSPNRELAVSARRLREKFADAFPEQRLPVHDWDVVHTEDSKIAGRIELATLQARDVKFGARTVKVNDLVTLYAAGTMEPDRNIAAQTDPGTLTALAAQVGKSFLFTVTGSTEGSIYGDGIYTTDSQLATACVHFGILKAGQTATVRVTIVPGQQAYTATTRNGITSYGWGPYSASYRVSRIDEEKK